MAEAGHEVRFWASSFDHMTKKHRCVGSLTCEPAPRLRIELLEAPGYPSNVSLQRIRHNRVLSRSFRRRAGELDEKPDLLFAGIPCLEMAEAATEFAQERGLPVVVDIEDIWPDLYLTALPRFLVPLGRALLWTEFRRARRLLRRATAVTAVSRTYLDWALRLAGRPAGSRDGVYPLGFPEVVRPSREHLERDTVDLRRRHGLTADRFFAVYLGQFGACYDLETVVAAARLIEQPGSSVHFVLAGAGDKDTLLREQARGLDNVTFTGWLDQAGIMPVLHVAQVGLAAYTGRATQSLPFKPFEYMAASLPIISSLGGELAELLAAERIGLQYEAGNPRSLADAVLSLSRDEPLRREMGRRAREIFLQRYDTQSINARLIQCLETIADASHSGH
jgi:glycosyltransferase involved in cell wall biosynthesis